MAIFFYFDEEKKINAFWTSFTHLSLGYSSWIKALFINGFNFFFDIISRILAFDFNSLKDVFHDFFENMANIEIMNPEPQLFDKEEIEIIKNNAWNMLSQTNDFLKFRVSMKKDTDIFILNHNYKKKL